MLRKYSIKNIFGKENKYKNKKTTYDNYRFDSKKEGERYLFLKSLIKRGEIKDLKLQPSFILQDGFKYNGRKIQSIKYIGDFSYIEVLTNKKIIEDVKGMKTSLYRLKKKLFLKKYGNKYKFIEI